MHPKNHNSAPHLCTGSPYRRRRIIWILLIVFAFVFFFGAPWELPAYLKDLDTFPKGISRANIAQVARNHTKVDQIYGLMHIVMTPGSPLLSQAEGLDLDKPIEVLFYPKGDENENWPERVKDLKKKYPVVVFSKTYCPFSKKAKTLLESYDLIPPPQFLEVDLRDDQDPIKIILTRLTDRSTFPNVLVQGVPIGGSDEIQVLHEKGELRKLLVAAGVDVRADVGIV